MTVEMIETRINDKWTLLLPDYRAEREEWSAWEVERLNAMCSVTKDGTVVWDIGSEEGDLTALYSSWGAEVALFEPNPLVWPSAYAIWEANQLRPPLFFCTSFVSWRDQGPSIISHEWPDFVALPTIKAHGFASLHDRRPSTPEVTLDTVRRTQSSPDIITIDVEGSELSVILGARNLLKESRPHVFVSVHPKEMEELYGVEEEDLLAVMNELKYTDTFLAEDHERHWHFVP